MLILSINDTHTNAFIILLLIIKLKLAHVFCSQSRLSIQCRAVHVSLWQYKCQVYYSGTSVKGPSQKGTTFLQRTLSISPFSNNVLLYGVNTFSSSKKRTAGKGQTASPKVSFSWRFHCIQYMRELVSYSSNALVVLILMAYSSTMQYTLVVLILMAYSSTIQYTLVVLILMAYNSNIQYTVNVEIFKWLLFRKSTAILPSRKCLRVKNSRVKHVSEINTCK